MIRFNKSISSLLAVSALFFILSGCEKQGSAEKAGKKIDSVVKEAGEKIKEAGEKLDNTVEESSEKVEQAGEKLDNAMEEAGEKIKNAGKSIGDAVSGDE